MRRPTAKGKGADIYLNNELISGETSEKEKASFYFTLELLNQLDQAWMQLRMKNRKLTKSELVQTALAEMLEEYRERQEESRLYQRLVGQT